VAKLIVLVALFAGLALGDNDPAVLHLRVIQGEGAVYSAGGRATRGVVVQVTDETGKPVADAAVSFRLPDQGPTGEFSGGGKTEIVKSGADGRAEVWGMQWGKQTGSFEMRITAAKGQTRGGVVCALYLSDAPVLQSAKDRDSAPVHKVKGHSKKKLWIGIALAAGASVAVAGVSGGKPGTSPTPSGPATVVNPPTIGAPTIVVTRP
jgi:hypothetical protein